MTDMKLAVIGAAGRMGQTLVRTIKDVRGCTVAGAIEMPGSIALGQDMGLLAGVGKLNVPITDDLAAIAGKIDGVLDFSVPAASLRTAEIAANAGLVHVIGTTGFTAADEAKFAAFGKKARIVKAGNMSLGVNLLAALTRKVAAALDADFDIEVLEMHHKHKVDAPSGTALMLGRAAAEGRGIDLAAHSVRVRDGNTGPRPEGSIGFASLRGGAVIGEHTVIFASENERIELVHKATDRGLFARGAVKAALWARGQKPGLYSMADVLGF
jgi:4-hydroxy-tetrahydrodipicolinate reductase